MKDKFTMMTALVLIVLAYSYIGYLLEKPKQKNTYSLCPLCGK